MTKEELERFKKPIYNMDWVKKMISSVENEKKCNMAKEDKQKEFNKVYRSINKK